MDEFPIFQTIPDIIAEGGKNQLAALLTIVILVSLLGYFLFKADKSHYRALVFVAVVAMGGFIVFAQSSTTSERAETPIAYDSPEPSSDAPLIQPEAPVDSRIRLPAIYDDDVRLGMSQQEVRQAVPDLRYDGMSRSFAEYRGFAIYKDLQAYDAAPISFSGGSVTKRFLFIDETLVAVNLRYDCEQGSCDDQCQAVQQKLLPFFSIDGVGAVFSNWRRPKGDYEPSGYVKDAIHSGPQAVSYAILYDNGPACGIRTYIFDPGLRQ